MATETMSLGINDPSKYNQYNNALKAVNDAARSNVGENFNTLGRGQVSDFLTRKHHTLHSDSKFLNKAYYGDTADVNANPEHTQYANALNDYFKGTGYGAANGIGLQNGGTWQDYADKTTQAYNTAMNNASNQLKDYGNTFTQGYNVYSKGSLGDNLVDQRNQQYFADAQKILDRDKARGYLSTAGYQTALNELAKNQAYNRGLLAGQGNELYTNWNTDLDQLRTTNFDSGKDSIEKNANNWLNNYNNLTSGTMDQLGSYIDTQGKMQNYANDYINDDAFLSALTSNTYNPDSYIATGAEAQGVYNPFIRGQFSNSRRTRRMNLDSIGEY